MKPKILITRQVFPEIVEALAQRFDVEHNDDDRPVAAGGAGAAPRGQAGRPRDRHGPHRRGRSSRGARTSRSSPTSRSATNNVDVPACTKRGIRVTNTPGVLDDTTADLTWALLMAAARRIAEGDAYVRRGDWKIAFAMQYFLGHGRPPRDARHHRHGAHRPGDREARARLRHARALPQPHAPPRGGREAPRRHAGWSATELLARVRLRRRDGRRTRPPTHHLIGAAEIAKMKPTAILVNTARGGVVDDAALVEALQARAHRRRRARRLRGRAEAESRLSRACPTSSSRRTSAAPRAPRA